MRVLWALFVAVAFSAGSSIAQEPSRFGDYEVVGASYHKFVLPGEASITVLVLGDARASGMYEIGRQTDLGVLLALSSATIGTIAPGETREITLRLYRYSGADRNVVYDATLEEFLSYPGQYPQLQDRDVVVVQTVIKKRFGWRDALSIITASAAVLLAVDRFQRLTR